MVAGEGGGVFNTFVNQILQIQFGNDSVKRRMGS